MTPATYDIVQIYSDLLTDLFILSDSIHTVLQHTRVNGTFQVLFRLVLQILGTIFINILHYRKGWGMLFH